MFYKTRERIKTNSANMLTFMNMSLGGFSIMVGYNGQHKLSMLFIFMAAFCDRWDGMVARRFQVESEIGKQLDSMCDLISFGVAPALLIYNSALSQFGSSGMFCAIFYIACGAFRLARFNVQTVKGIFIGVPIPVAACTAAFSYLFVDTLPSLFYMFILYFLGVAMVSTVRMKKI